ncbi:hypothetical protein QL285_080750 [Trifolium repens]|nr:hypothetical protein QL285_080750 [Trifolium repens]
MGVAVYRALDNVDGPDSLDCTDRIQIMNACNPLANERITAATTFPSSCFTPLCLHAAVISPPPSFPDSTFLKTTFCSSSSRHSLPQNLPVKVDGGLCRQKPIYELRRRREGILVVSHRNRVRKTTCFSIWTGGDLNSKPTWKS